MKLRQFGSILSVSALAFASTLISSSPALSRGATFICSTDENGLPATTVESSQHGNVNIITWNSSYFERANYDNQRRCEIVSAKFQKFSDRGTLKYLTNGMVNRQPVICAVANKNAICNKDNFLYTLKSADEAEMKLKKLRAIRSGASTGTRLYETQPGEAVYVDFEQYMEENGTIKPANTPLF